MISIYLPGISVWVLIPSPLEDKGCPLNYLFEGPGVN